MTRRRFPSIERWALELGAEIPPNEAVWLKTNSKIAVGNAERIFAPNDPKLSERDPEARVGAQRREAKARRMPGFMAGAYAVTEPVEVATAHRQLNARVAVRCSA